MKKTAKKATTKTIPMLGAKPLIGSSATMILEDGRKLEGKITDYGTANTEKPSSPLAAANRTFEQLLDDKSTSFKVYPFLTLSQINTSSMEGKLLFAALTFLTTNLHTDKTPDQSLNIVADHARKMFSDFDRAPSVGYLASDIPHLQFHPLPDARCSPDEVKVSNPFEDFCTTNSFMRQLQSFVHDALFRASDLENERDALRRELNDQRNRHERSLERIQSEVTNNNRMISSLQNQVKMTVYDIENRDKKIAELMEANRKLTNSNKRMKRQLS